MLLLRLRRQHEQTWYRGTLLLVRVDTLMRRLTQCGGGAGQLYYLKRHVEGVRPDVRLSNHFKNYKRWRQQYHPGEPVRPRLC